MEKQASEKRIPPPDGRKAASGLAKSRGRLRTETYSFGVSRRESHDSSKFYHRRMFTASTLVQGFAEALSLGEAVRPRQVAERPLHEWADRIYCHTSERMDEVPDSTIALAFTSPPYNAGKDYDEDLALGEYLGLLARVGVEVLRVLKPGGRYVVNVANLGRRPYVSLHAYVYALHVALGFLPVGEVVWQKAKGANGSCAWGSWCQASAPQLRDVHEYLLVFCKENYKRPDRGTSDISPEEFMAATLSVWTIPPESAERVKHPAPFPVALAERVIRLYSYVGDVVLDPFCGSGTTCVAARKLGRRYVGYDIEPSYCAHAERRIVTEAPPPLAFPASADMSEHDAEKGNSRATKDSE